MNLRKFASSMQIAIVYDAGPSVGLGHFSRSRRLSEQLLLSGFEVVLFRLYEFLKSDTDQFSAFDLVIFDVNEYVLPQGFDDLLQSIRAHQCQLIAIDGLFTFSSFLNFIWVPSFYLIPDSKKSIQCPLHSGWECYLLDETQQRICRGSSSMLVSIGGSDITGLGSYLPAVIDEALESNVEVHWVQGPYAPEPELPDGPRLKWVIHHVPESLQPLMQKANYALCAYGVSFFECLQHGIPTVVFSPYGDKDKPMLEALKKERVAVVADSVQEAVEALPELMDNDDLASELSERAMSKLDGKGAERLVAEIKKLLAAKHDRSIPTLSS